MIRKKIRKENQRVNIMIQNGERKNSFLVEKKDLFFCCFLNYKNGNISFTSVDDDEPKLPIISLLGLDAAAAVFGVPN